jgi:hypothetical protein
VQHLKHYDKPQQKLKNWRYYLHNLILFAVGFLLRPNLILDWRMMVLPQNN